MVWPPQIVPYYTHLIGLPVRLTVSKRTLKQGKIEYKPRSKPQAELLAVEQAIVVIKGLVEQAKSLQIAD